MATDRLRNLYDPDSFRREGHLIVDALAEYLRSSLASETPLLNLLDPSEMLDRWSSMRKHPKGDLQNLVSEVLHDVTRLHDPRCMGHQVPPSAPISALAEMIAALTNNGMAVYEMGQVGVAMEQDTLHWMAEKLGLPSEAGGVLTSGGSLGNLTALLAARQVEAGYDAWEEPAANGPPLALITSDQAHYSLERAVRLMGWGRDGLIRVETDPSYRMRTDMLGPALERARKINRKVIGVVAAAGSTSTGNFDPIDSIADFCSDHGLWLHVDAAHGAACCLSPLHEAKLKGISRADSIVWDAHKLLALPALVTAVLFRDGQRAYDAFSQEASYIFRGDDPSEEWFNPAGRTFECTKRMMSLELQFILHLHGEEVLRDYVEATHAIAHRCAEAVRNREEFELAVEPESNILCYRHVPRGVTELDSHQTAIRNMLLNEGNHYIVQTRLDGTLWLRSTFMNPFSSIDDFNAMLDRLTELADAI